MSGFCTLCGQKIEKFDDLECCPFCGTDSIPCDDSNNISVTINWHELHLLVVWAEYYANMTEGANVHAVYSIAHRLEKQYPNLWKLTLAGELSDLKRQFPTAQVNYPGVE